MSWSAPTTTDFKNFFVRDFNFAPSTDPNNLDYVTNTDITNAINEALVNFNQSLFGTDAQITIVFMYLVAFYLVFNLQNSAKGISSQSKFPISSNSVGSVSVNFQLPTCYQNDPLLSMYASNGYGMKYLSFALPQLPGGVDISEGDVNYG